MEAVTENPRTSGGMKYPSKSKNPNKQSTSITKPRQPANEFPNHLDTPNVSSVARTLCNLLTRTSPQDIESALTASGIRPSEECVNEVIKLSYNYPHSAVKFFRWAGRITKHSAHAWNLMVDLLGQNQLFDPMWDAVRSMKQEGVLSLNTFMSVFQSYCIADRISEAVMSFDVMDRYEIKRDVVAVNSLLSAICRVENQTAAAEEFLEKVKGKIAPDGDSFAILLEGWEKEGNPAKAKSTFGDMVLCVGWSQENVLAYDAFLMTLLRALQFDEVVNFLEVMKEHECYPGIITYNGLESCIHDNQSYEDESRTSRGDGCITDSFNDDDSSCSSSKDAFGSFSSKCLPMKRNELGLEEWELSESPKHFYVKEEPVYAIQYSDVEDMKEKFAKLLLGDDITGGSKGSNTALALSNAITNLAVTVFGELWKLEPLCEERKNKWRREMNWLLSPTKYMVELVPAKQNNANGGIFEIMTPKARADICINLPALQKLDSMLIETLDLMVHTEFWYAENGSRAEGRNISGRQSKRWWLPSPQVPRNGLSDTERKRLLHQGKVVNQVFKAAKAINDNMLLEMPVPSNIRDALVKSGKASLGEELHRVLNLMAESHSEEELLKCLNFHSEHSALETINKLEAAIFSWKERIMQENNGKSPVRTSWYFMKDPVSGMDKMEVSWDRAEHLIKLLKTRYPNLPLTFLDAAKVQYGKDIGHSILEAYSRVLGNLAFSILSRIGDILQEDALSNPNSPMTPGCTPGINLSDAWVVGSHIKRSLIDKLNKTDVQYCDSSCDSTSDTEFSSSEAKSSSVTATPSRSRVWCIGREACKSLSPQTSP